VIKSFRRISPWFYFCFTLLAWPIVPTRGEQQFGLGEKVAKELAAPHESESTIHHPKVLGWEDDQRPQAPAGFEVNALVREIESPRWLYVLPNGDVLVAQARTLPKKPKPTESPEEEAKEQKQAEGMKKSRTVTGSSPNQITLLRDADGDGNYEVRSTFAEGLNQPFGMALVGDTLFIATTDALLAFEYERGDTQLEGEGRKIATLPAGGYNNHWTRNVIANRDGSKLYVSVGSASNVGEYGMAEEHHRANILEMNPDGSGLRVFASGLRNPVGMDWEQQSGNLWTAVNERDELGDDVVPDYLTSVEENGFYGWPYSYFGSHEDPRLKGQAPELVASAIVPDLALGAHTASLGLAFYRGEAFPEKYHGGAFIGQRGSWNRSEFAGYRVAFAPFRDGKPTGDVEDFLTGFIANDAEVYGRPVGVAVAPDGSLLVADEPGGVIWRVSVRK
jgi:glucose/arabinose dehydrogenase